MHRSCHTLRAFSLVELAVALLLTSLVVGFGLQAFNISGRSQCYTETKAQMATIKDAIERFAVKHDRFPMPADRTIGVENPEFGREAVTTDLSTINGAVFGALPFQALGIPVANATDCWGNKYTYAVTEDLVDPTKFLDNATDGKLDIKSDGSNVFLEGAGYALISHGADELGAVKGNYSGMTKNWCTTSTELRTENCDIDDTDLVATEFNDGKDAAAAYYDDLILYRGKPWRMGQESNAWCWGTQGLGDGVNTVSDIPVRVKIPSPTTSKFTKIDAGAVHTCALGADNHAYCWGVGYLGDGPSSSSLIPVQVVMPAGVTSFVDISAGLYHSCALDDQGQAYCWGKNSAENKGVLGDGTTTDSAALVPVIRPAAITHFKSISAGATHTCALGSDDKVYCWGNNRWSSPPWASGWGILGRPMAFAESLVPIEIVTPVPMKSVDAGDMHSCGIGTDDHSYCWGGNGWNDAIGALGDGGTMSREVPYDSEAFLPAGVTLVSVTAGFLSSCGLGDDGNGYCWGSNGNMALGSGLAILNSTPRVMALPTGVSSFKLVDFGGMNYGCAISNTNRVYCWGLNGTYLTLGVGPSGPAESSVALETSFPSSISLSSVSTGSMHACALSGSLPPINGGWTIWTPCSGACGGGAGTQTRTCTLGAGLCAGSDTQACVNSTPCGPPPPPPPPPPMPMMWVCEITAVDSGGMPQGMDTCSATEAAACAACCPGTFPGGWTLVSFGCVFK